MELSCYCRLIELADPVTTASPVTLLVNEDSTSPAPGDTLTVIGVGTTSENGDQSDTLLELEVPFVTDADCNDEESYNGDVIYEGRLVRVTAGYCRLLWRLKWIRFIDWQEIDSFD